MAAGMGAYLADDWALMTETIPLISSGRYMGLANVANSIATPAGLVVAGLTIDVFTRAGARDLGPRVGVASGLLFLAGAALLLRQVRPRRDPRSAAASGVEIGVPWPNRGGSDGANTARAQCPGDGSRDRPATMRGLRPWRFRPARRAR